MKLEILQNAAQAAGFSMAVDDEASQRPADAEALSLDSRGHRPLSDILRELEERGYTRIHEVEIERDHYVIRGRRADQSRFRVMVDLKSGRMLD